jgi:hypothetical protein
MNGASTTCVRGGLVAHGRRAIPAIPFESLEENHR